MLFIMVLKRLKNIALTIHHNTCFLKKGLEYLGFNCLSNKFFDTLKIKTNDKSKYWVDKSIKENVNFRYIDKDCFSINLDETTSLEDVDNLLNF